MGALLIWYDAEQLSIKQQKNFESVHSSYVSKTKTRFYIINIRKTIWTEPLW